MDVIPARLASTPKPWRLQLLVHPMTAQPIAYTTFDLNYELPDVSD
jgi:transcriptional regulator of nitric oxide reductase